MSEPSARQRLAFLFPGQGSQKVGMGQALVQAFPAAREVFDEVDAALGFSLSRLCFEGPEAELTMTANAQPAILTTSIAALRVLEQETPLRPSVVAGHSLGEYSALVCAGALSLADAARLVRLRGQFMQEAVPAGTGGMAAILGLGAVELNAACQEAMEGEGSPAGQKEIVAAANFNGGGQIVIAGHKAAVERACAAAKRRGAKAALPLAVSAPFHSALMQPAAERLALELAKVTVRNPGVPVVTNVEASPNQDGARVCDLLTRQVTAAVRWEETILKLASLEISEAIEVGHGSVLAGLVKRINKGIRVRGASDPQSIGALREVDQSRQQEEVEQTEPAERAKQETSNA
ncbi:MAG: ACP S-malonyltransferase [Myxococcales bacterium]